MPCSSPAVKAKIAGLQCFDHVAASARYYYYPQNWDARCTDANTLCEIFVASAKQKQFLILVRLEMLQIDELLSSFVHNSTRLP